MNRSLIVAVLTVTMIIMMSTASFGAALMHSFSCDNCHGQFIGGPGYVPAAKSCIGCHSPMGEANRMPVDSMANYFGSVPGQPATGSRSTHTYMVSYSSAGASIINLKTSKSFTSPAQTAALVNATQHNNLTQTGQVTCNRCHNAAGNTYTKPMLRATNANDALCLDCHRNRLATDTKTGTHAVNYRAYSTVYKLNTTAFRKVPLSPNANNPTAKLGNYLQSGKIVCSTCHSVHYGDSNSATLDNRSTASGFAQDDPAKGLKGQLQNSKGQLLRTDPVGVTASAINVCSSCHKETKNMNHNGKGQNVQCDHCHGAHVDYTGDGSLPNIYLVRRDFSNISISAGKLPVGKKVIYNTATSLRFQRADGNGICQICHTPTPGVGIHDDANTRSTDCIVCHKHSNGFSAADCTSCHGQPPISSAVGGPNGKASASYSIDESLTPHATHADKAYYNYACKNCHYSGTKQGSHNTSSATFQSVFVDTAGGVGAIAGKQNYPGDYNLATRTCANVYCHSNGMPRGVAFKAMTTPSWEYGRNKILSKTNECSFCHGYGTTLVTNAHQAHVTTVGINCYVCHNATVTESGRLVNANHANGVKNISFLNNPVNFKGELNGSFNSLDASCTNSCHGSAAPVWTTPSTGACGTCHAVPATSGAHTFHFSGTTGPNLGSANTVCSKCHDYAAGNGKHANGMIDLKSSCAPCHPAAVTWTNAVTVTCESCHTGTASVVANGAGTFTAPLKGANGHTQYSTATVSRVKCTTCHSATANHINAGAAEKRLVLAFSCSNCHTAGKGLPEARIDLLFHGGSTNGFKTYTAANSTTAVTTRSADCAGCHDTHGTTNLHNLRTTINGRPITFTSSTGLFTLTKSGNFYNGLCQACHTKTKYYRNYTTPAAHYTTNCLSCHKHKDAKSVFAFEPVGGGCGGCHGYPPAGSMAGVGIMNNYTNAKPETNLGAGGAHTVAAHIPKTARQGEAWVNCSNCHYNQDSTHNGGGLPVKKAFVNVVVDPKYKFNNLSTIKYNASTCSNVSCHFKATPNWTTGL